MTRGYKLRIIRRHRRQRKFRKLLFTTVIIVGIAIGAIIPSISTNLSDINRPAQTSHQPITTNNGEG
ncbi:MAG: hypothetical protein HYW01_06750 [Deltaproteobacteria bacterium]|nr:hypothetical protein [Deltaproteobacteria bacterium]